MGASMHPDFTCFHPEENISQMMMCFCFETENLERLEKGELKLDYEPEGDAASLSASSDLDSEGEDTEVLSSQSSSQSSVESEPEEFCSSPVTGCSSFDLQVSLSPR